MKRLTIAFVFTAILQTGSMQAQLNESDTARMQLRAGITGAWQQGNIDLLTLRGRFEMVSNGLKPWVFKTQNTLLYQEFGGRKADNDLNSRNYLYFHPQKKVYPFAMAYISTNYRRRISSRWFAGGGATWQAVNRQNTVLKLSASMVYEQTRFKTNAFNEPAYNGSSEINLWRATGYFSGIHHLFQKHLRLYYTVYCQPGFDDAPNLRWQLDAGIDLPVWKGLNATVVYAYSFEEVVPVAVKQVDRILTFGISYQYKKQNHRSTEIRKSN
jgi:Protein of unknown function, DUF481